MRRPVRTILLALAVSLFTALPLTAARAAEPETVTFAWPASTRISVQATAGLVLTDTGLTGPRRVIATAATATGTDEVIVYDGYLTPESPTVAIPLPSDRVGRFTAEVEVTDEATRTSVGGDTWTYDVVRLPSSLTARFPGPRSVPSGATVAPIRGTVAGAAGRVVQVQAKAATGWVTLGRARTTSTGTFTIDTPTWWVHRQTLRVYAPATDVHRAVASADTGTMTVTRRYAPRGGRAYSYSGSSRSRWDPCQVITYRVNPTRLPAHGLADVREGFRRLAEATGLRFAYAGTTARVPGLHDRWDEATTIDPHADLVIAWATARQVPGLRSGVVGLGGGWSIPQSGWGERTNGFAVFDSTYRLPSGYSGERANRGGLILHELAHAVGLGHVSDRRQIMYPAMQQHAARYAAGDLRGLAEVGAVRGCFAPSTAFPREPASRPLSGSRRLVFDTDTA